LRYLPADRVLTEGIEFGSLSVRTRGDREIGKLLGFVIDTSARRVRSLIVDSAGGQLEGPIGSAQLDAESRTLRYVSGDDPGWSRFSKDTIAQIAEEDLWVPFFPTAA
jgi:hypothetical protein